MMFTIDMASAGELKIREMSERAQKGYVLAGDVFQKVYYRDGLFYVKGEDNRLSAPMSFESLELSLESWVQTIDEYVADAEWSLYGTSLEDLKDLLLSEGFEEHEIDAWIEKNEESYTEHFLNDDEEE